MKTIIIIINKIKIIIKVYNKNIINNIKMMRFCQINEIYYKKNENNKNSWLF